jgi:hypothetical protein
LGEVGTDWEISLNQTDWRAIVDCETFNSAKVAWTQGDSQDSVAWREQRLKAHQRWLQDSAGGAGGAGISLTEHDSTTVVERDSIRTQAVLQAQKSRRSASWAALLALFSIAGAGIAIWLWQGENPIQANPGQTIACKADLSEGVNWTGCNRRGVSQPGAKARNAHLNHAMLDDARLKGADLAYASLKQASLRNAELAEINLNAADLTAADLTGADLSHADLSYAVLTGVNLTGVRFNATRLDKATWIDGRICAQNSIDVCQ